MLPRRHRAAPVGDLPEQLAVGLALDGARGPVGGLGIEGHRGGAITLPVHAVTGLAVYLRDLLAQLDGLLSSGRGFFLAFSTSGATQEVCASSPLAETRAATSTRAATRALNDRDISVHPPRSRRPGSA